MVNSMTGYGNAARQIDGISYMVEIKTVNNRYFKVNFKLPDMFGCLEKNVEALLRVEIHRGTINYVLRIKDATLPKFNINTEALKQCAAQLEKISTSTGMNIDIRLSDLLMLPGIIDQAEPDENQTQAIAQAVAAVSREALDKLNQMRAAEGAALVADLKEHIDVIRKKLVAIRQRFPNVIQGYHEKLRKRVNELLAGAQLELTDETLAREVAVFAERCDISEELSRLDSHLEQFLATCDSDGDSGRRLDFISQEMLREANTIASKAADADIAQHVIEIKCRIDRLKEQVQNVE
ncbi:MAG: YicC/YloC family endoribonuclease [Planctomycetota bacterium]